jgi:glycosyltransferase involved in cell wall biosynthesis
MAENYPAMIRSCRAAGEAGRMDWLVRNPAVVSKVERWVVHRADHILVVVEESRDRLVRMGVPAERITIVSNTPTRSRLEQFPHRSHETSEGEVRVVYLGMLDAESRGVGTLLDALALCRERGVQVRATLMGDGKHREVLVGRAHALQLGDRVRFTGRVENQDALRALADHDVGIVPHHVDEHSSTTIPNKVFDYMAAGLACVVSDAPPLARVVRQTASGEVFRDRDAADLARVLESLCDASRRASFGAAGRAAIASQYHWEADESRLLGVLESLKPIRQEQAPALAQG